MGKKFLFIPSPVSTLTQRLSSSHQAPLRRSWLHFLDDVPTRIGDDLRSFPPKLSLLQMNQSHSLSLSSQGPCSSPNHHAGPTLNLFQFISDFLLLEDPKLPLIAGTSPCPLQAHTPQVLCYSMANSCLEIRLATP